MRITQSWGTVPWNLRKQKALFRGRDSNPARVEAARSSVIHRDILDAKITSWEKDENFEAEEELGGGAQDHIQLREFAKYKYIVGIDGTVAAFRTPYLLFSKWPMLVHIRRHELVRRCPLRDITAFGLLPVPSIVSAIFPPLHQSLYSEHLRPHNLWRAGQRVPDMFVFYCTGGSLLIKQDSKYYEWYQNGLKPFEHFLPYDGSGTDLIKKIRWAIENDQEAKNIAQNGISNLLPFDMRPCPHYSSGS